MSNKVSLTCWGGVGRVTGANFLIDVENKKRFKFLVDCGLFQEGRYASPLNREPFPYNVSEIDCLFITHAHADHIGRVPKLTKEGFKGTIYSTVETMELSRLMFADALRIMKKEAQDDRQSPIYDESDIEKTFRAWQTLAYHTKFNMSENVSVTAKDAGHILGSAIYEFEISGKKIVFTGDLGNSPSPIIKDAEKVTDANFLIMESVYGDRNHEDRESRLAKLKDVVVKTVRNKGTLVIPAFSIERTQVILYELNGLLSDGQIEAVPVFLDSPLAIQVTEIYKKARYLFNPEAKKEIVAGDDVFDFPKLKFTYKQIQSERIEKVSGPKIIIAGGGMSEGGRVIGHEQKYLPDPNSTIMLVGFQSAGTLGRHLLEGAKEVLINGEKVKVRASIEYVNGYSSHMDSDHLIEFAHASVATLKTAFIVMGEPKASLFLTQRLRDYAGINAVCPELGTRYQLF